MTRKNVIIIVATFFLGLTGLGLLAYANQSDSIELNGQKVPVAKQVLSDEQATKFFDDFVGTAKHRILLYHHDYIPMHMASLHAFKERAKLHYLPGVALYATEKNPNWREQLTTDLFTAVVRISDPPQLATPADAIEMRKIGSFMILDGEKIAVCQPSDDGKTFGIISSTDPRLVDDMVKTFLRFDAEAHTELLTQVEFMHYVDEAVAKSASR